jgi:hypothetical protein
MVIVLLSWSGSDPSGIITLWQVTMPYKAYPIAPEVRKSHQLNLLHLPLPRWTKHRTVSGGSSEKSEQPPLLNLLTEVITRAAEPSARLPRSLPG